MTQNALLCVRTIALLTYLIGLRAPATAGDDQLRDIPGGVPSMGYSEALKKAETVAILHIYGSTQSLLHGIVTGSVKGLPVGTEVCVVVPNASLGGPYPAVNAESLLFLFPSPGKSGYYGLPSCSPSSIFRSLANDAPNPIDVQYTWEIRPCAKAPCVRGLYCPNSCSSGETTVRSFASVFPEIAHPFPAQCPDRYGDTWFLREEFLAALRHRLVSP